MKPIRILLCVITLYFAVIGALYLFAPGAAERVFQVTLSDRSTAMLHGFGVLILAGLAYTVAADLDAYSKLVRLFQLFALGETLIFAYQLITGMATFAQVGPPIIIWSILTVLFLADKEGLVTATPLRQRCR